MDSLYVGAPTHVRKLERMATRLAPAHAGSHECWRKKPVDRVDCDSYDGIKLAILAKQARRVAIFAQSDLSRGTRGRCSAPAAHVGPQQLEVVVADLATPRRHGGRLAIEHRIAEALEVVLGKLP